tara:strand:+ start:298 stop:1122 length:825 start_codon:yes stop_codon:yes gene_type:complete
MKLIISTLLISASLILIMFACSNHETENILRIDAIAEIEFLENIEKDYYLFQTGYTSNENQISWDASLAGFKNMNTNYFNVIDAKQKGTVVKRPFDYLLNLTELLDSPNLLRDKKEVQNKICGKVLPLDDVVLKRDNLHLDTKYGDKCLLLAESIAHWIISADETALLLHATVEKFKLEKSNTRSAVLYCSDFLENTFMFNSKTMFSSETFEYKVAGQITELPYSESEYINSLSAACRAHDIITERLSASNSHMKWVFEIPERISYLKNTYDLD